MPDAPRTAKIKGGIVIEEPPMLKIKSILCPIDWSEPSLIALQTAIHMARYEGAELVLLHVLPPLGLVYGIASVAALQQVVQDEATKKLTALIAECVPPDVRAQALIRVGEEADETHLAALQADVVVMSTHGRSSWVRWAFGSVAETVMREAVCPIFVLGPAGKGGTHEGGADKAGADGRVCCFDFPYKQVLWPTDWSEASERALDEAIAISTHHGAQLLMLHVIEASDSEMAWLHEEHMEKRLRKLCKRKAGAQNARRLIGHGVAAAEIARIAAAEGVDLIVMSTHGRTGWQRLKLGSVTQKVLREVPCPVFLVPHPATSSSLKLPIEPVLKI